MIRWFAEEVAALIALGLLVCCIAIWAAVLNPGF